LHLVQLLSLNRDWLVVDQLVELTVLLENHLRLAALGKVSRWILWLAYTRSLASSGNDCFFAIVYFRITLSGIKVSADLQLICLRNNSRISFLSIDSLLLSLIHSGVSPMNQPRFIRSIDVNSRFFLLVCGRYGWGCRSSSSTLSLLLNSFVQSLLLLVLEQCLLVHLLLFFSYYTCILIT
jgi:hypothetical protein